MNFCAFFYPLLVVWAQEADIRDIKPPVYFKTGPFVLIFVCVMLVLAVFFVLRKVVLKKLKKTNSASSVSFKLPHQIAYEALEELKNKSLPEKGKIKEYFIELSYIVRHYIENRFKIKAAEMTTEEFLFFLTDSDVLGGPHKNLLKEFLRLCDIVKFAKYAPVQQEIEKSFNSAKKFVDETKETEELLEKGLKK